MSEGDSPKCLQCNQPLTSDGGYCLSCGFSNTDTGARKQLLMQSADQRIERARIFSRIFRFIFWSRLVR